MVGLSSPWVFDSPLGGELVCGVCHRVSLGWLMQCRIVLSTHCTLHCVDLGLRIIMVHKASSKFACFWKHYENHVLEFIEKGPFAFEFAHAEC